MPEVLAQNTPEFPKVMAYRDFYGAYIEPSLKSVFKEKPAQEAVASTDPKFIGGQGAYVTCADMQEFKEKLIQSGWKPNYAQKIADKFDAADGVQDNQYIPVNDKCYLSFDTSADPYSLKDNPISKTAQRRGESIILHVLDPIGKKDKVRFDWATGAEKRILKKDETLPDGTIARRGGWDEHLTKRQMNRAFQ